MPSCLPHNLLRHLPRVSQQEELRSHQGSRALASVLLLSSPTPTLVGARAAGIFCLLPRLGVSKGKLPGQAPCSLWNTPPGWDSIPLPWQHSWLSMSRGSHPSQALNCAAQSGMGPFQKELPSANSLAPAVYPERVRCVDRLGSQPRPCSGLPEPQFPPLYNDLGVGGDGTPHLGNRALCHPA